MANNEASNGKRTAETAGHLRISLWLKSQDGNRVCYKTRIDKKLKPMLMGYCIDRNLDFDTAKFLYDGGLIKSSQTPEELGLEDGDEIDVMFDMSGGSHI